MSGGRLLWKGTRPAVGRRIDWVGAMTRGEMRAPGGMARGSGVDVPRSTRLHSWHIYRQDALNVCHTRGTTLCTPNLLGGTHPVCRAVLFFAVED